MGRFSEQPYGILGLRKCLPILTRPSSFKQLSSGHIKIYNLGEISSDNMSDPAQTQQSEGLQNVEKEWSRMQPNSPIYDFLLSDIELLSASKTGSMTARLKVKACHINSKGTLHGVVSAGLVDWAGSLAIAATGLEKTGASTDIHTSFVSTAKEGDLLEISATAAKVGGTLAFTNVEIRKLKEDASSSVVATGSHTKYVKQ